MRPLNLIAMMQLEKIRRMHKYNLKDIKEMSAAASKMGLKALLTQLYTDPDEYLRYVESKRW